MVKSLMRGAENGKWFVVVRISVMYEYENGICVGTCLADLSSLFLCRKIS